MKHEQTVRVPSPLIEYCICTQCGKRYTDGIHKTCDKCREHKRQYVASHRDMYRAHAREHKLRYKALGLCVDCGKPAYNGGIRCYEHNIKHRMKNQERRQKIRAVDGYHCCVCGAEIAEGKRLCKKHIAEHMAMMRAKKEEAYDHG